MKLSLGDFDYSLGYDPDRWGPPTARLDQTSLPGIDQALGFDPNSGGMYTGPNNPGFIQLPWNNPDPNFDPYQFGGRAGMYYGPNYGGGQGYGQGPTIPWWAQ